MENQIPQKKYWPKNPIFIIFGFIAGAILTALITASVNNYFLRSRPYLEIANIDFSGTSPIKAKFMPSSDLVVLQRNSPIGIDKFAGYHSLGKYKQILFITEQQITLTESAVKTLDTIISKIRSSPFDTKKQIDNLRIELLQEWDKVPYARLEKETRSVLHKKGYIRKFTTDEKYKKYREHPEWWKKPLNAKLMLSPTRSFDLSEVEMEKYDYNKIQLNMFKRLWINMDKDLLIEIFGALKPEIISVNDLIVKFRDALVFEMNQFNPERIHCNIVFSNLGEKAAVFKGTGVLSLIKSDEKISIPIKAHINNKDVNAFSIPGGSSLLIDFYSYKTVEEIESEQLENLKAIYDSQIINSIVSFAEVSDDAEFEKVKCEGVFGKSANVKYIEKLTEK